MLTSYYHGKVDIMAHPVKNLTVQMELYLHTFYQIRVIGFSHDGTVDNRWNVNNAFIYNIHPNN